MISRRQLPELRTYVRAEAELPFTVGPEYGRLVVPNGNSGQPVHGWFKYKEAFSADLLSHLVSNLELGLARGSSIKLLDPFCGVGTSLVSSQLLKSDDYCVKAVGIECNPFSAFVARTKTSWPGVDPKRVRALAKQVFARKGRQTEAALPELSSIKSGRCITKHAARQIMVIRDHILRLQPSVERDVLAVGLAACIESVSKVRRDGRALRLVDKPRTVLRALLAERWEAMAKDVELLRASRPAAAAAQVILGDGRESIGGSTKQANFDLILTSPPYPNNIDYNEVYKLELWLMGFVTSPTAFLSLRRQTYRSHPTCSPLGEGSAEEREYLREVADGPISKLLGIVIRRAQSLDQENSRGRSKVLLGYAYDTWQSLKAHYDALKPGGCAVYIVGNSLHGGSERPYLVPTDLMLACLAKQIGFHTERLIVARSLQRRLAGNHFLRDSVLVLRKN